jgi:hypothetical protein
MPIKVPLDVLACCGRATRVERLSAELGGPGLVADYRLDAPGPLLVLHDVMRAYLQTRQGINTAADKFYDDASAARKRV